MDGLILHTQQTAPKTGDLEWSGGLAFVPTQKQPGAQGQMLLIVSASQVWKEPGRSPVWREIQLIPDPSYPGREQQDCIPTSVQNDISECFSWALGLQ